MTGLTTATLVTAAGIELTEEPTTLLTGVAALEGVLINTDEVA